MKTKLAVEIETPEKIEVFPEEGQGEEDFEGKEPELQKFREDYARDLHSAVVTAIQDYLDSNGSNNFEEDFIEDLEELYVEGQESLDDYGIKIKTTTKNN